MAKQALTINDFSGGLNTEVSSRDLEPNELSTCQNADPSSKGKLLNTMVFSNDDTNFDDFGAVAPQIGTGLFVFSNDKTITDDGDNTGDFIVKPQSSTRLALQEVQDTDITITDLTGINVPEAPQFYAAEGDLYIGGDHSDAPTSAKFHSQDKFGAGRVDDWLFATQVRTAPTNDSDMEIDETDSMTAATYDGGSTAHTGLGADDLNWIIHYEGNDTGLWNNKADGSAEYIEWGGSWLYKNNAESSITPLDTGAGMAGESDKEESAIRILAWTNAAPTAAYIHVYGARLYAKISGTGTWFLAAEANYEKGIRGDGESDWTPWSADGADWGKANASGYQAATGSIAAPPLLVSYETFNGHTVADIVDTVHWKHGVVANSRAYIGNVLVDGKPFGDRILKSPVFQYDVFAESSYIDVASNDGDEIKALATYGDMLLQFKERKLYLINISKELEYMEDVKENAGVKTPAAVCKTPFGVAWANYNGAYLYNGAEVTQLTMGKISDSDWNTNVGGTPANNICGYDPVTRQLIVLWDGSSGGSNRGKAYVFTFDTNSWHYVSDMIASADQNCTNMVNTSDGKLLIGGGTDINEILVYGDRSSTSTIDIRTGQLSLGNPAVKKNLTNVKVRYKYGGSDLAVSIITNNDSDDTTETTTALTVEADSGEATDYLSEDDVATIHTREYNTLGIAALQNQYWFQVKIAGTAHQSFELDEVVLTYRELGVR